MPRAQTASRPRVGSSVFIAGIDRVLARVQAHREPGDVVVVSVHAGSNWGYAVPHGYRRFAQRLVDGGVDVVHGHSSHHRRPVEVYRGRRILYGCGDLVNDYEGIGGWESYRAHLRLPYFAILDGHSHELVELRMVPVRARRLRLKLATGAEVAWVRETIGWISRRFSTLVEPGTETDLIAVPA